jgi:hypothetical protein
MRSTITLGITLFAGLCGCYAPPTQTTPVQSAGVRLSVPGVYCTFPRDDYDGSTSSGELGAQLKIENTTDHVATLDAEHVQVVVNGDVEGEIDALSPEKQEYVVPPHSERVVPVHVYSARIRCDDVQTIVFENGVLLDGKTVAVAPLRVRQ